MKRLTEYLDEALPPGTRKRLEQHLAGCAGCSLDLNEIRTTVSRLRALPGEKMPIGMKENLLRALHNRQSA
ncbi:MAG TPA: anti-sigma factor [Longimicrobiaceae bacterium]|nr:anti-sigma factor [Longimicrobiaceae bacterium]